MYDLIWFILSGLGLLGFVGAETRLRWLRRAEPARIEASRSYAVMVTKTLAIEAKQRTGLKQEDIDFLKERGWEPTPGLKAIDAPPPPPAPSLAVHHKRVGKSVDPREKFYRTFGIYPEEVVGERPRVPRYRFDHVNKPTAEVIDMQGRIRIISQEDDDDK